MHRIDINHFKAFGTPLGIHLAHRNSLLLYGENGAGKTSLFEALRLMFFRERLLKAVTLRGARPEETEQAEKAFYMDCRHRGGKEDIQLRLNDTDFRSLPRDSYRCFMLSGRDVIGMTTHPDRIQLTHLLQQAYIDCPDVTAFVTAHINDIVSEVNSTLHDDFAENVAIGQEDDTTLLYITSTATRLRAAEGLHSLFNEAIINLVRLLLLLVSIRKLADASTDRHKVLVLDDIVTSLDSGNRHFIVKYLLTRFSDLQTVVLTHNIGFFNTFALELRHAGREGVWKKMNLYLTNSGPHLHDAGARYDSAETIRKAYDEGILTTANVGNEIRKRYEEVVLELSKLLQIEAMEETKALTRRLTSADGPVYLRMQPTADGKMQLQTSADLVSAVRAILTDATAAPAAKVQASLDEIAAYHGNSHLQAVAAIIREMKTYQKIMLHQLSHGTASPLPPFSQKEVMASLALLAKLEHTVHAFRNSVGMM